MQKALKDLIDKHAHRPALVIGGGPSVNTDLPRLPTDWAPHVVFSANQHGYFQHLFPVDYMVNVDKIHSFVSKPMREFLRQWPARVINRYTWADYRLCEWPFNGNSGFTAIAVAAALGCDPIIVTGIDLWKTEKRYFHNALDSFIARRTQHVSAPRRGLVPDQSSRIKMLAKWCEGANIRPISGPLTQYFPQFDLDEMMRAGRDIPYRAKLRAQKVVYVRCLQAFSFCHRDNTRPGWRLALSEKEAQGWLARKYVEVDITA